MTNKNEVNISGKTHAKGAALRALSTALAFYFLGLLARGLIYVLKTNMASAHTIAIVEKVFYLCFTLGSILLLRWLIVDAPFNLLRKYTIVPLLKTMITLLIYFGAAMFLLNKILGINLVPLLTTSAILTGILALSLQETLKNLFTGIWINTERIVAKGDWVKISDKEGLVMDVTWRTTRLLTRENDYIYLTNRVLAEGVLENYTYPSPLHVVEIDVPAGYNDPPNRVKNLLIDIAANSADVVNDPKPEVWVTAYGDYSLHYRLRVWIKDYRFAPTVKSDILGKVWYAFRRNHVEIPYPVRTIYHKKDEKATMAPFITEALRKIDFLSPLKDDELHRVAEFAWVEDFGEGDIIVKQDYPGETCYFIQSGSADVMLRDSGGKERFIATLGSGGFFGEMSLLAGEPRRATVVAREDCRCIVIDYHAFQSIFRENPHMAERLSDLLAKRSSELEEAKSRALSEAEKEKAEHAVRDKILGKIKRFFNLG